MLNGDKEDGFMRWFSRMLRIVGKTHSDINASDRMAMFVAYSIGVDDAERALRNEKRRKSAKRSKSR